MRVNDPNLSAQNAAAQNLNSNASSNVAGTGKTAQLDPLRISSGSPGANEKTEKSDSVQLSALSSKINELQSDSPERDAYVESLRAQVADGSYQANSAEISKKIVDELLNG